VGRRSRSLEGLVSLSQVWRGRTVFLTGHTGFKGAWLALWLTELGATVHGYALEPPTSPNLFDVARVAGRLERDTRADLADLPRLKAEMRAARPDVVLHLAAQPLVRESYRDPMTTWLTNVIGTAHVLEAVRECPTARAVVVVTTDKVYENRERPHPYREDDPLGGNDPYSASKAACEIVVASYRRSFFGSSSGSPALIASARAGNVIGGADWAVDRLVPDCLRAFERGQPVSLRYPSAVRPWQHVLEPLSGYVTLAEALLGPDGERYAEAWNFGPEPASNVSVRRVADLVAEDWGGAATVQVSTADEPHEAGLLTLDSSKACTDLSWRPRWSLEQAVSYTVAWHKAWRSGADMAAFTVDQIRDYVSAPS
jgi:CDP-glucose 4,6-dehydratase